MATYQATPEALESLVHEMNSGYSDADYQVVETVHYRERGTDRTPMVERDYIVTHTYRGKTTDIATLNFGEDGALRSVLVERGLAFELVPRALRSVAS